VALKALVHIGGEKTGTTSIQEFCARNRARLADAGILYPASLGSPNHVALTAYSLADLKVDDLRRDLGILNPADVRTFRERLRHDLAAEIHAHPGAHTLLLSNEHLQSRLLQLNEVKRLRDFLTQYTDDIKLIVYLRRQDRVAVSYYSTKLKASHVGDDAVFPLIGPDDKLPPYYDFDSMLKLYELVFGIENIIVRILEPRRLTGGDLLVDFRATCAIPEDVEYVEIPRRNESLSEIGIAFFKRFNEAVPRFLDGRPNFMRGDIIATMMKRFSGSGPQVARRDAEEFYSRFVESNGRICARYFPAWGGKLFDDDFSTYDRGSAPPNTAADFIDVGIHLWVERTLKVEELRLENALLNFHAAVKEGKGANGTSLPDIPIDGSMPASLLYRCVGAMLYGGEFRRAAGLAGGIVEAAKGRSVFVAALAFASVRMGQENSVDELIDRYSTNARLAKSLREMKSIADRRHERPAWLKLLKQGDALQSEMYHKCLAWLEH